MNKPPFPGRHFLDRSRTRPYDRRLPPILQSRLSGQYTKRKSVTIGIGLLFEYSNLRCALVCADSKIVTPDWATSMGGKVSARLTTRSTAFVIAYSCADAKAARMLSGEITSALSEETTTSSNLKNA